MNFLKYYYYQQIVNIMCANRYLSLLIKKRSQLIFVISLSFILTKPKIADISHNPFQIQMVSSRVSVLLLCRSHVSSA